MSFVWNNMSGFLGWLPPQGRLRQLKETRGGGGGGEKERESGRVGCSAETQKGPICAAVTGFFFHYNPPHPPIDRHHPPPVKVSIHLAEVSYFWFSTASLFELGRIWNRGLDFFAPRVSLWIHLVFVSLHSREHHRSSQALYSCSTWRKPMFFKHLFLFSFFPGTLYFPNC